MGHVESHSEYRGDDVLLGGGAAAQSASGPELVVDADVNSEVWMRDRPMTKQDLKTLVERLRGNGCQTLLIRCGYLRLLPHRTPLSYPVGIDAAHARANPTPTIEDMESYITQRTAWNQRYAEVIQVFNPPEAFIRAAHAQGMKALVWLDLFDDGFPGYRSKFLDEHPHCQWVAKDGKTHVNGLMDYAWPEARAFRVTQARELLDLGADGVHCSTSSIAVICPTPMRRTSTATVSPSRTRFRQSTALISARPKASTGQRGTI